MQLLIDTGAGMTCLHPRDAITVGVPRRSLVRRQNWPEPPIQMRGVGGKMEYYQTTASYAFGTTTGDLHVIDRTILVAKATPVNMALPSLLGWDILRDFHLTVHQDTGLIELDPIAPNIVQVPQSP